MIRPGTDRTIVHHSVRCHETRSSTRYPRIHKLTIAIHSSSDIAAIPFQSMRRHIRMTPIYLLAAGLVRRVQQHSLPIHSRALSAAS